MAATGQNNRYHGESEKLLASFLAGDNDAFTRLVRLYEERLYAFLARFTGDPHLAEDIFQQAFIKVAANAAGFDHKSSFSTWLFKIARNTAIDELRKRKRGVVVFGAGDGEEAEPAALEQPLLEKLAGFELQARIMALVEALPDAQREAFLLKEEAEMTFDEIAAVTDCSRDTAKSRFRLAVEKLRLAISADPEFKDFGRERHG